MVGLFDPVKVGGIGLENRLIIPPMCQYSSEDGLANDWHLVHIGSLSMSGASLVIMEATAVAKDGRITHDCLGLWRDDHEEALADVVSRVKHVGSARLGIQLSHAGRKASTYSPRDGRVGALPPEDGWQTVAPSPVPASPRWPTPHPLDSAGMQQALEDYVASARRAVRAGFDVVELHAAHGYLLSSFLSPLANQREDEFGGTFENRARFPLDVVRAVREQVPDDRAMGVRVNGTDWAEGGITPEEAVLFSVELQKLGVDYVHVSSGGNARAQIPLGAGYQIPPAAQIKQAVDIPVVGVGLISDPVLANELIESGKVDIVGAGRAHLHNPHWGWLAAEELGVELKVPYQYARARLSVFAPPASWGELGKAKSSS